jgi:hypothetical protein
LKPKEFYALKKKAAGASKYGPTKVSQAGYSFASKLERALFDLLKLREMAGEIRDIQCQDSIYLTDAEILYKPDFKYTVVATGEPEWAESKGFPTPSFAIKKRLWKYYGPGRLLIYEGTHQRLVHSETIIPTDTK